MKVPLHKLGRRVKDALRALDRNESVTIHYRDTKKAILSPVRRKTNISAIDQRSIGMWRDRKETEAVNVTPAICRKGRLDGFLMTV